MPPQSKGNTLPLLDYALAFTLQLGKLNENPNNRRQRKLQTNCCVNLAALLAAASDASLSLQLPLDKTAGVRQPSISTSTFQATLTGSPHQQMLSQDFQSVL